MKKISIAPRENWEKKVEDLGLVYNTTPDGRPYWNESEYYQFSMEEIDEIEEATNELHEMCMKAAEHVIKENLFHQFCIPEKFVPLIKWSFENEQETSVYGRFDLAYKNREIKMLEYNADTPTSLLEASVIQWLWKEEVFPKADQFNSIHERLVKKWDEILTFPTLYFVHSYESAHEDFMNVTYMRDTAEEAGTVTEGLMMDQIGWLEGKFVDLEDKEIKNIFKLYPWEWMVEEEFADNLLEAYKEMKWIEPIWKMLLSNKAILPILWELYPNHKYLLEASFEPLAGDYVKKPKLSREGQNIVIVRKTEHGELLTMTDGSYDESEAVYQKFIDVSVEGKTPILGSWVVGGEAAGMGIRECAGLVTDNTSQFIPHIIV